MSEHAEGDLGWEYIDGEIGDVADSTLLDENFRKPGRRAVSGPRAPSLSPSSPHDLGGKVEDICASGDLGGANPRPFDAASSCV